MSKYLEPALSDGKTLIGDTQSFKFHSAGGVAELPWGCTETKVIDQRAPERKYADCAPNAQKESQMLMAENNF